MATMRTRFVNRVSAGISSSTAQLKFHLKAMNVGTLVIYLPTIAYYIYAMVKFSSFYLDPNYSRNDLNDFIYTLAETTSILMLIASVGIWTSFIFMFRMLKSSANLQGSNYK